ncbi:MAG: metal ABC transporter substrate-binding protein [Saprospiraceae bacterium]|nr:MAG: metal ABC transporter substrate-binding protein [Saprospiraceae bacterium]
MKMPLTLLLTLCLSVLGAQSKQKPLVVATASIFADMAQQIAGDLVEVQSIVPIGSDPHIYEPTPADVRLVARADLLLVNGLTFEGWLQGLIKSSGTRAPIVVITEGIEPIQAVYKNSTDPHAWMSAANGLIYIENIYKALVKLDPAHKDVYEANYLAYKQKLEELDRYIMEQIQTIPEQQRILITSHDAFQYYGRRYGLRLEAVLGVSTEADAQTSDIIRITQLVREHKVPAVFIESTVNPKLLEQIARDNGVAIGGKLYSDSIGGPDSPAPTYLDMLKYNTDTIVKALRGETQQIATDESTRSSAGGWWLWLILGAAFIGAFLLLASKIG